MFLISTSTANEWGWDSQCNSASYNLAGKRLTTTVSLSENITLLIKCKKSLPSIMIDILLEIHTNMNMYVVRMYECIALYISTIEIKIRRPLTIFHPRFYLFQKIQRHPVS